MEEIKETRSKDEETKTERMEEHLETLPFPVVTLSAQGRPVFRNRLAKKLLPPPSRLGRFLHREWSGDRAKEKAIVTAKLEGVSYFVGLTRWSEHTVLSFLETSLPLHPVFSRALLERARELFPEFDRIAVRLLEESAGGKEEKERLDRISARIRRLREEEGAYLRLMRLPERRWEEPVSCSLDGFLRALTGAMQKVRVTLCVSCPTSAIAWVSPSVLGFVMVNLLHFIMLFEGEDRIDILVEEGEKESVIQLCFPDREGLFSLYGALTCTGGETVFPQALAFAPLFCAMTICRESGLSLHLFKRDDRGILRLTLPGSSRMPEAFLGARDTRDREEVAQWVREIFLDLVDTDSDSKGTSPEKK